MNLLEAIQACKKKNLIAQKYLFDRYARQMYSMCYRYVNNHEDAEELMLNGFYKFYKNIKRFHYKGGNSVFSWLKKIMINECLMFLRKKKKFKIIALEEEREKTYTNDDILTKMAVEDIYRMITELPIGYRTVFNLYVIEGYSHKEIAESLKISEGTSKSQLSKARRKLQLMIIKNRSFNKS